MAVDKMDWHAVTFPDSIPYENAGTHIGMYLAWLILNDHVQEDWKEEFSNALDLSLIHIFWSRISALPAFCSL